MHKSKADDLSKEFKKAEKELNEKIDKFEEGIIRERKLRDWMKDELDQKTDQLKKTLEKNL
jgi:uncharacterized protein (DUF608 family)